MPGTCWAFGRHCHYLYLRLPSGHRGGTPPPGHPPKPVIMAIIRSIAVGKARKSAGNVTFRTVRGRTIMSEKVAERPGTRLPGDDMTPYQFNFACINRYAAAHKADIDVSFDKTKYGSQRNYFVKLNYYALSAALATIYASKKDAAQVTDDEIEEAIADYAQSNPNAIYRVRRSGYSTVYLSGEWTSSDNPAPAEDAATVTSFMINSKPVAETSQSDYASGNSVVISGTNLDASTILLQIIDEAAPVSDVLNGASISSTQITGTLKNNNSSATGNQTIAVYQGSNQIFEEVVNLGGGLG